MAILPLSKVTLYGSVLQKQDVLNGLQDLGCLHLVDLGEKESISRRAPTVGMETHQALKYLRNCPIHRQPVQADGNFELHNVVEQILQIEHRAEHLQQQADELMAAIEMLKPWGEFRTPQAGELGTLQLWFYVIPHNRLRRLPNSGLTWQIVSLDHQFAYVVVVSPTEPEAMPAPKVLLDPRSLSDLRRELQSVMSEQEGLHWRRVELTRWIDAISRSIDLADDEEARVRAMQKLREEPQLFALQGWTARRDLDRLRAFAAANGLALTIEPPSSEETPPTLLHNRPLAAGGQEAVTFFTTPAYNAWDPSSVVFVSFSLFFAMIMADAGYALVLGGLLLLIWQRVGRTESGQRIRRLALSVVLTSLAYGILIGSYFGTIPAEGTVLGSLRLLDPAETQLMMHLSIGIGVVHLSLANLAVAWLLRGTWRMLSPMGWTAILLGGLSYGLGASGVEPSELLVRCGGWLLMGGALAVLCFSSDRPLMSLRLSDHLWRLFDGVRALVNLPRAFGDALSYLRLFALGLASAQLATTFNGLTHQVSSSAGLGTLLAVLVAVFGHGLNLTLAVVGGVVHGLRLNVIEFFGWGLTEEGYPFQPFCRKAA